MATQQIRPEQLTTPLTVDNPELFGADIGFDYEFNVNNSSSLPSGWAWTNQGTSTYLERYGAGVIKPQSGGESLRLITRTLSGAPASWVATAKVTLNPDGGNWNRGALCLRESSSGKICLIGATQGGDVHANKWTNATTYSADVVGNWGTSRVITHYRITKNSSSSWDFAHSPDGVAWSTMASANNLGLFMTPDEIGFLAGSPNGNAAVACHWLRLR